MTQWVKVLVTKPDVLSLIPLGPTKWKKKTDSPSLYSDLPMGTMASTN